MTITRRAVGSTLSVLSCVLLLIGSLRPVSAPAFEPPSERVETEFYCKRLAPTETDQGDPIFSCNTGTLCIDRCNVSISGLGSPVIRWFCVCGG